MSALKPASTRPALSNKRMLGEKKTGVSHSADGVEQRTDTPSPRPLPAHTPTGRRLCKLGEIRSVVSI